MLLTDTLSQPKDTMPVSRSWDIVLIGMVFYGLLACGLMQGTRVFPFGQNFYDEYFLAILDGHLDLPARVVQIEGHYTPDGTAYLYHGVGPLIPRFLLGWFWPFQTWSLAPVSIWSWACIGTLSYHAAFLKVAGPKLQQLGSHGIQLSRFLGIAIWFGSPGVLLAASTTFYHEPIVLTYALTGGFVLIWSQYAFGTWPLRQLLLPSAFLAAVALQGRPNVAIGLYLASVLLALYLAASSLKQNWLRIGLALLILGASGFGFLTLNSARFGSLAQTHGSFEKSSTQYGSVFWGAEDENSDRANAFKEHGKFNLRRIPHNLSIYAFDLPKLGTFLSSASERLHAFSNRVLAGGLGFIRIEAPHVGLILLWPIWLFFCAFSPQAQKRLWLKLAIPLTGAAAAAILTLAYGTVTLRYRVDLWPFISLAALPGLSAVLSAYVANPRVRMIRWGITGCFIVGIFVSAYAVSQLRYFQVGPQLQPSWSLEMCQYLAQAKTFSPDDIVRICQSPRIGG